MMVYTQETSKMEKDMVRAFISFQMARVTKVNILMVQDPEKVYKLTQMEKSTMVIGCMIKNMANV